MPMFLIVFYLVTQKSNWLTMRCRLKTLEYICSCICVLMIMPIFICKPQSWLIGGLCDNVSNFLVYFRTKYSLLFIELEGEILDKCRQLKKLAHIPSYTIGKNYTFWKKKIENYLILPKQYHIEILSCHLQAFNRKVFF